MDDLIISFKAYAEGYGDNLVFIPIEDWEIIGQSNRNIILKRRLVGQFADTTPRT